MLSVTRHSAAGCRGCWREPTKTFCGDGTRQQTDAYRLGVLVHGRYAQVSEHSADEALLIEAQKLAERALRRLTYTKGSINNALTGPP